jgi:hypothetical protein
VSLTREAAVVQVLYQSITPDGAQGFLAISRRKGNMAHKEQQRAEEAAGAGYVTFTLDAPHAEKVFLRGTFNAWDVTTPMQRGEKGRWEVPLKLPPGSYRYRMFVDDQWQDDPGAKKKDPNSNDCVREVFGGHAYGCNGMPLNGVCVFLTDETGTDNTDPLLRTTRTDDVGYYCFDDLSEGREYTIYYPTTHYDRKSRNSLVLLKSCKATFKPDGKQFHMPGAYYDLTPSDQKLSDLEAELKKEIQTTKKKWEAFDSELMEAAKKILKNYFDEQLQERPSEPGYIKDFKQQFKELRALGEREVRFLDDLLRLAKGQDHCPPADLASLISVEYLCQRTLQQMTNIAARRAGLCQYVHSLVPPKQIVSHPDVEYICDLLKKIQPKVEDPYKLQVQSMRAAGMSD